MNRDVITVQDCIDIAEKKGKYAVINDGEVVGFEEEQKKGHEEPPFHHAQCKKFTKLL